MFNSDYWSLSSETIFLLSITPELIPSLEYIFIQSIKLITFTGRRYASKGGVALYLFLQNVYKGYTRALCNISLTPSFGFAIAVMQLLLSVPGDMAELYRDALSHAPLLWKHAAVLLFIVHQLPLDPGVAPVNLIKPSHL